MTRRRPAYNEHEREEARLERLYHGGRHAGLEEAARLAEREADNRGGKMAVTFREAARLIRLYAKASR